MKTEEEARAVEENVQLKAKVWELEESLSLYESNGSPRSPRSDGETPSSTSETNGDESNVSASGKVITTHKVVTHTTRHRVAKHHSEHSLDSDDVTVEHKERVNVTDNAELLALQAQVAELTAANEAVHESTKLKMSKALEKLEELKLDLDTKTQELFIANQSIHDLQKSLQTLQHAQHEEVSQTLAKLFEERSQLQSQVLELHEALAASAVALSTASGKDSVNASKLLTELEQCKQQSRQTQSQLEAITAQCMQLSTLADSRSEETETVRGELQTHIDELNANIATIRESSNNKTTKAIEKIKALMAELAVATQKVSELETQLSAAQSGSEGQQSELSALVSQLQAERGALQEQLEESHRLTAEAQESCAAQKEQFKGKFTSVMEKLKESRADLEARTRELSTAGERVTGLEALLAAAQLSASRQDSDIVSSLREDLESLREKFSDVSEQLSTSQLNGSIASDEVKKLTVQLADANAQVLNTANQLAQRTQQVEQISAQCVDLSSKLDTKSSEIDSLRSDLTSLSEGAQGAAEERERLELEMQTLQITLKAKDADIVASTQRIHDLETQLSAAQQGSVGQSSELSTLIAQLQEERSLLQTEMSEKSSQISVFEAEIARLQESQLLLNAQVTSANEEVDRLEAEQSRVNVELDVLVTCNTDLKASVDQLEDDKFELEGRVTELTASVETQKERVALAVDKYKMLKAQADEEARAATERISELERVTALPAEEMVSSDNLTALQLELSELSTQLVQSTGECEQLRQNLESITSQCMSLSAASEEKAQQIDALQSELDQTRSELEEAQSAVDSVKDESKGRSAKAIEKIKTLMAEKHELSSQVELLTQEVETRDTQLISYSDHLNTLDLQIVSLNATLGEKEKLLLQLEDALALFKERESGLRRHLGEKSRVPTHFEVLMRCSDGDRNWCLVSRGHHETQSSDASLDHLSWNTESEVLGWIASRDSSREANTAAGSSADSSFSIDVAGGEDVELPPTVQDELREVFARERQELLARLEDINTEKENSQQAFDKYRERAKVSLMKTATDLQAEQVKVGQMEEAVKEEKYRTQQAEAAVRQLEFAHQQALERVRQSIRVEKEGIDRLRTEIASLRADVAVAADEERLRVEAEVRSAQESSERLSEDSGEWQAKIDLLVEQITTLQGKEKMLTSEMRKKGDLARQIILGKDEEIAQWRTKAKQAAGGGDMNDGLNCFQPQPASSRGRKGPVVLVSESQTMIPRLDIPTSSSNNQPSSSSEGSGSSSGKGTKSGGTTPIFLPDVKEQVMDRGGGGASGGSGGGGGGGGAGLTRQQGSLSFETEEILSAVEDHALATARSQSAGPQDMAAFNEELYRRAVHREQELLEQIRQLKGEILRSKQSIMGTTPRKARPPSSPTPTSSNHDTYHSPSKQGISGGGHHMVTIFDDTHLADSEAHEKEDGEREQRLTYLKQAFLGFFKAKKGVEMQHLGRVICAILGLTEDEQYTVMEGILKLAPADAEGMENGLRILEPIPLKGAHVRLEKDATVFDSRSNGRNHTSRDGEAAAPRGAYPPRGGYDGDRAGGRPFDDSRDPRGGGYRGDPRGGAYDSRG
eukprot:gene25367-31818_t